MANEHLKNALQNAGLTVEQFAEIISVDPKTVQRWVAGRTPYARHRATIARALDMPQHQLWPGRAAPPASGAGELRASPVGEVIGSWGRTTHPAVPNPAALLAETPEPIDMLDDEGVLLLAPGLLDALREWALDGRAVRVLTLAPSEELHALIGREGSSSEASPQAPDSRLCAPATRCSLPSHSVPAHRRSSNSAATATRDSLTASPTSSNCSGKTPRPSPTHDGSPQRCAAPKAPRIRRRQVREATSLRPRRRSQAIPLRGAGRDARIRAPDSQRSGPPATTGRDSGACRLAVKVAPDHARATHAPEGLP